METENAVNIITIVIALLSVLGTIATSHRAIKKDAFEDLQSVVEILQKNLSRATEDIKRLNDELKASESRVSELEAENALLKNVNLELQKAIDKLSMRLNDSMIKKRNHESQA